MAGRRSRHRRISSWDANLEGRKGVDPSLISPTSSGDLTATRSKVQNTTYLRLCVSCHRMCLCVCPYLSHLPALPPTSLDPFQCLEHLFGKTDHFPF